MFRAFASENGNISRAVADLPGTLQQTTATLAKVQTFANLLGPTATSLLPAARALPAANQALTALARPSAPIVQNQIRPFVIAARPLVRNLRPAAVNLAKATPNLTGVFTVLNHLFNDLGYNPTKSVPGQHGYLWWLAWLDHNARTLFSVQDAASVFRPLFVQISCAQLQNLLTAAPIAVPVLNFSAGPVDLQHARARLRPRTSARRRLGGRRRARARRATATSDRRRHDHRERSPRWRPAPHPFGASSRWRCSRCRAPGC